MYAFVLPNDRPPPKTQRAGGVDRHKKKRYIYSPARERFVNSALFVMPQGINLRVSPGQFLFQKGILVFVEKIANIVFLCTVSRDHEIISKVLMLKVFYHR